MENQEAQQNTPPPQIPKTESPKVETSKRKEKPSVSVTSPLPRVEIWSRIRYGHVATAMRVRSLLLFISSTLVTFIETISEPKTIKIPPTEIITRIVANFISGSVEQPQSFNHETFLDILLEKIPNSDVKGMHYHEVYLAISPMITSVNWARIKFDRRDAMMCYNSLSSILQTCFQQVGLATRAEADQLFLAIYVSSVWCSILKQHAELSHPISDHVDYEAYMKTWVFNDQFENFSKVFVASCCQIMESSDHIKKRYLNAERKTPLDPEGMEIPQPLSLTASIPEVTHHVQSPALPPITHIHPSWRGPPPQYDQYGHPYMNPGPMHFVPYPPPVAMHPPIDPHPHHNYSIEHIPPVPQMTTPKTTKRKQKTLPNFQELTDTVISKSRKKGPKPGTKYRQRITNEASMILEMEASLVGHYPPDRHSKRRISERTNISLYQVKSFFNRITAEERRLRMGEPQKKKHKCKRVWLPC